MPVTQTPLVRCVFLLSSALPGVIAAAFLLAAPQPVQAAVKVVGSGTAGSCDETALREALAGGGDISFSCSASPNPIVLTDQLVITSPTTIDGTNGGNPVTISGGGVTRVFYLNPGVNLSLDNLTLRDGTRPSSGGGAIYARGFLSVTNSRFYSNTAEFGGAIASLPGSVVTVTGSTLDDNRATANVGGAIQLRGPGFVSGSHFHHNTAVTNGGGIFADDGAVLVVAAASTFDNNTAQNGGGLSVAANGILTVTDSAINGNQASGGYGGAVHNAGTLFVAGSRFFGNQAGAGGAISSSGSDLEVTDIEADYNHAANGGAIFQGAGLALITGSHLHHNSADNAGGGLFAASSTTLTLANSEVNSNSAGNSSFAHGAGLRSLGTVTVTASAFHDNAAHFPSNESIGGGIYQSGGRLVLETVDLDRNSAGFGGGVLLEYGVGEMVDVSFVENEARGNDAGLGGGMYIYVSATVTLSRSVFLHNQADQNGGAMYNRGQVLLVNSALVSNTAVVAGGGLHNFIGTAEAYNVTFSSNTAGQQGGGVRSIRGATRLAFVTLTGNSAPEGSGLYNYSTHPTATLYLEATLLAGNELGNNCHLQPGSLGVQSGGYNLSDDDSFKSLFGSCPAFGLTDLGETEPLLGPVDTVSGPTPFHPLMPGSPAIDFIPIGSPGNWRCGTDLNHGDQGGQARPIDGDEDASAQCDIGAVEFVPAAAFSEVWIPLVRR